MTIETQKCKDDCMCSCDMSTCACNDPEAKLLEDEDGLRYYSAPSGFAMAVSPKEAWEKMKARRNESTQPE